MVPERALVDLAPADLIVLVADGGPNAGEAWRLIVERHVDTVWKVVRCFGLSKEASWDAYQSTWLRAIERLETLREPQRFDSWLKAIARNEALAVIRARSRLVPTDDDPEGLSDEPAPGERLLRDEQKVAVRAGFAALPQQCQDLLRLLTAEPRISYDEIERLLGMKHGSIGPTRGRCLDKLRRTAPMAAYLADIEPGGGSG